ncbi:amphiphysin [Chrysoperla carnea]|uniref:amphiphysin n=1 Tax=Chrysoperla carnea TaxID=189513 RepID=UPI001D086D2C|nr:amphiphysin [Chrysoperla carnea]
MLNKKLVKSETSWLGTVRKMAESKGALIAKTVQKHAGRAKEKFLQNFGKVDRTADEIFDEHLENFTRQQNAANKLQKEFSNYIRCVRAVQTASKSLMDSISEVYESQWTGHDLLYVQAQNIEMLWQDFSHKLGDQVLIPLNTYQSQFPEMRKKIDKRGRKLVDYDGQRHNFQNLQANNAKKRDDVKLTKAREQLEEAKRTYEQLNSELHDELPALYDSRVLFLVTNLQTLFSAEQVFHNETSKAFAELEAIVDKLATNSQRGSYTIKKSLNNSPPAITKTTNNSVHLTNNTSPPSSPISNKTPTDSGESPIKTEASDVSNKRNSNEPSLQQQQPLPSIPSTNSPTLNGNNTTTTSNNVQTTNPSSNDLTDSNNASNNNKRVEELYDIPVGASTDNLPPGVLYRVKATYKYNKEDVDELSFEVGDTIRVVEYDDPEEQEEGWLMGIKESTNEKGMFPANFTRPI